MANKVEFIDELVKAEVFKSKAEAERALTAVLETFETFLVKGEEVNFIGWGKFSVEERGERKKRRKWGRWEGNTAEDGIKRRTRISGSCTGTYYCCGGRSWHWKNENIDCPSL